MRTLDLQGLKQVIELAMDREVPAIELDADLYTDIGMDSIGAVAMIVEIQRRCQFRINEADVPVLRTPRLLLDHISIGASLASKQNGTAA